MKNMFLLIDGVIQCPIPSRMKMVIIVLISKKSFGPLEVYECGLDNNHNPYERYEWLENDLYEDEKYCKNISEEELLKQIFGIISIFKSNGLSDWINFYMEILGRLAPGLPG